MVQEGYFLEHYFFLVCLLGHGLCSVQNLSMLHSSRWPIHQFIVIHGHVTYIFKENLKGNSMQKKFAEKHNPY
jgi:hypothetical protein